MPLSWFKMASPSKAELRGGRGKREERNGEGEGSGPLNKFMDPSLVCLNAISKM